MSYRHIPAMLNEVVFYLNCRPGNIYVDCTLGGSGHAKTICKKIIPEGMIIGIDQDIDAIVHARKVLHAYPLTIHLFHGNFIRLPEFLAQIHISSVDRILLDLGVSLHQLENSGRGFSFRKDEPLDMRMDVRQSETAEGLINRLNVKELQIIFKNYGEERWAKQIARTIVSERRKKPIRTSEKLAQIVMNSIPARTFYKQKIHPATRVFMALRIAVNQELDKLKLFMDDVIRLLNPGGRLCVLSFHSLEDRIVKQRMKALEKGCTCPPDFPECVCGQKPQVRSLTKKIVRPTKEEITVNPMARSTRLRAVIKL